MGKSKGVHRDGSMMEEDDVLCDTPISKPTSTPCKGIGIESSMDRSPRDNSPYMDSVEGKEVLS